MVSTKLMCPSKISYPKRQCEVFQNGEVLEIEEMETDIKVEQLMIEDNQLKLETGNSIRLKEEFVIKSIENKELIIKSEYEDSNDTAV